MTAFVVDASVTAAWLLPDEQTAATDALQDQAQRDGAIAPSLWRYEVANLLLSARKRRRAAETVFADIAALLPHLRVEIDADSERRAFGAVYDLAVRHSLTAYDAAYLDLALLRRLPLATLDADLRKAAIAEGLAVLP